MRPSWVTVAATAALALGQGHSHAQAPALPDMAVRGVQCQLVEEALFALPQIGPRDGPDSLAVQSAERLRAAMRPETLRLYESLAKGYLGSDAYDNGAEAYAAAVGRYVDRALRACAQAWFADADAQRVDACAKANLAGAAVAISRRRDMVPAQALQTAQKVAPVGEALARQLVDYFYQFPADAYAQPQGATRISGGAKERCLGGTLQPLTSQSLPSQQPTVQP